MGKIAYKGRVSVGKLVFYAVQSTRVSRRFGWLTILMEKELVKNQNRGKGIDEGVEEKDQ